MLSTRDTLWRVRADTRERNDDAGFTGRGLTKTFGKPHFRKRRRCAPLTKAWADYNLAAEPTKNWVRRRSTPGSLFRAQCDERIDARRAPGGYEAGGDSQQRKQEG